jgi:signal transduction histidine kinase
MNIEEDTVPKLVWYKSLPFKIGLVIIVAQAFVLAVIGFIYSKQYGDEIYRQIEERAMLPAELMSRGLLGIDAMNDRSTMEDLLKEKLQKGLVIGLNGIIFSSLNNSDPGRPLTAVAGIDSSLFSFRSPAVTVSRQKGILVAVTPVYGSDGHSLRFFTYLQLSTSEAVAKRNRFLLLFILGSLSSVFFTSVIILASFRYLISSRLDSLLTMVNLVGSGKLAARDYTQPAKDELGLLQYGVNAMAAQLEKNVNFLEQQVSERTSHLKTAAHLVEELNSIHDLDLLLTTAVKQLQQSFSYYQVHIFLKDDDTLVHRAGYPEYTLINNSLPIDAETSLIGQAASTGEIVTVSDVRTVSNWLREPDMSEGLTEIDIPIIHEGKIFGVLDVQRRETGGINDGDISLLRSLAGHLAVALVNVRLFKELQEQSLKLRMANEKLEIRVSQRTNELVSSNIKLQLEIEERRVVEDQLRQSQKVEALGRLTGGVAHDFNNILTVILGNCDLLIRSLDTTQDDTEYLHQIRAAARQAAALTNQLLAFSRQQVLMPTLLNLNDIVSEIKTILQRLLGENIILEISLAPDLCSVHVDRSQIEQILMNLAVNATDAMQEAGQLKVETSTFILSEKNKKDFPGMETGSYGCLRVRDTGCGIAPEMLSRIFDPFFTTKKIGKGTGLGLSTVYGIVKQSGGSIFVDSVENRGTVFSLFFPQVDERDEQDEQDGLHRQVKSTSGGSGRGSETILLVEDEPMVREVARVFLSDLGYSVLEAENAVGALQLVAETQEIIDLLVTDIRMPGSMNGFDIADDLTGKNPKIKILFMSGYIDVDNKGWEKACFLQKPFTLDTLSAKVREVLGS